MKGHRVNITGTWGGTAAFIRKFRILPETPGAPSGFHGTVIDLVQTNGYHCRPKLRTGRVLANLIKANTTGDRAARSFPAEPLKPNPSGR
ncbi:MAG: hypothetical protein VX939_07760 [Pseudomonadota bacterium]|nr:hypothetical protein [Pseudomonadota bacterium]